MLKETRLRVISGGPLRRSRLHDEKGNLIGVRDLLLHAPAAAITWLLRAGFGYRPVVPWIAISAIRKLKGHLGPGSDVLEFGSGMSTVWLARRARHVFSVEDSEEWFKKVSMLLAREGVSNVTYRLAAGASYCKPAELEHARFDVVLVDGSNRSECLRFALPLLRRPGLVLLDNSDKHSSPEGGDTRVAEDLLIEFAHENKGRIEYITDFAPCQLFVQQSMFVSVG